MLWIAILAFLLLGMQQARSRHRNSSRLGNRGRFGSSYRKRKEERNKEEHLD